jgi:hypothetical protein
MLLRYFPKHLHVVTKHSDVVNKTISLRFYPGKFVLKEAILG